MSEVISNLLKPLPRKADLPLLLTGAARGGGLFLAFALSLALLAGLIGLVLDLAGLGMDTLTSFEDGLIAGFVATVAAAAMTPNAISESFDGTTIYTDVLIAVPLLVWLMFVVLRGIGRDYASSAPASSRKSLWLFSSSVATGFIVLSALVSLGIQGLSGASLGISGITPVDFGDALVSGAFISIIVSWSATQKSKEIQGQPADLAGLLGQLFGKMMGAWAALVAAIVIYLMLFLWMEPDFEVATRSAESANTQLSGSQILTVLAILLILIVILPALLFYFFSLTMGATYGFDSAVTGLDVAGFINSVLGDYLPGLTTSFSLFQISAALGLIAILGAFFVSMFVGASASKSIGYQIRDRRELFLVIGFVSLVFFFLSKFFTYGAVGTNRGSLPKDAVNGELILEEFNAVIGVSAASLTLLAMVLGLGFYLGAGPFRNAFNQAFPGLTRAFSGVKGDQMDEAISAKVLSFSTIAVVAIATTVPMSVATTERVWGAIDNPVRLSAALFEQYQLEEVPKLKAFAKSTNSWLDDDVLDKARQIEGAKTSSTTLNNVGEKWEVGDLETRTTYLIENDDRSFTIVFSNSGTVRSYWEIDHPEFKTTLVPGLMKFEGPADLKTNKDFKFKVNGEEVDFGTYQALPGSYRVESTPLGMISAIDHTFLLSSSATQVVDFSNYLAIPETAKSQIEGAIADLKAACSDVESLAPLDCPTKQDFTNALTLTEDSELNGGIVYFTDLEIVDWSNVGLEVTDKNVRFNQTCTPVKTEVTALASSLPKGVEKSLFTSVTWSECDYTYSLKRTFTDAMGESYELDLYGESTFLYYIQGEIDEKTGEFSADPIKFVDKTSYPE